MTDHRHGHARTMRLLAGSVLVSLTTILLVWVTGMHMDQHNDCILAELGSTDCAAISGFQNIAFHVNAFTQFVNGAGISSASVLIVVFFAALASFGFSLPSSTSPPFDLVRSASFFPPSRRERLRWLALFEHSPSLAR